jgi:hypothetical protein
MASQTSGGQKWCLKWDVDEIGCQCVQWQQVELDIKRRLADHALAGIARKAVVSPSCWIANGTYVPAMP